MKYSSTKNKDTVKKGTCERIVFHISCSVLQTCFQMNKDYYLADNTGFSLSKDGLLSIDDEDGTEKTIPWILQNYLKVWNIKYASKTKFFCVQCNK